jgi:sortase B
MRKVLKWIGGGIVILLMILIIIRYFSSSSISNRKYDTLKSEVTETINETEIEIIQETTHEVESISPETEVALETSEPEESTEVETEIEAEADEQYLSDYIDYNPNLLVDYQKLKSINNDYRGWLNIPDTKVSYPVPQGIDNNYYLHKLFETQQYEYAGSLYIDAYSTKLEDQDNLIIYGHNMRNGTMFGDLKKFKEKSFFDTHPYIEFYTENEKRVYLIFSIRTIKSNINSLNYQLDEFDIQDYINKAIAESEHSRDIDTKTNGFESNPYSQIISLSTCVGDTSKRLLVSGIRIK